MAREVVLCAAARTAIGKFSGMFQNTPATELGANVISAVLERSGLDAKAIETVVMGNVIQAGAGMNPARQASIAGGVAEETPAMTVNRVCGSGAQAILSAAQEIMLGSIDCAIAGGMENMDQAPYLLTQGRWGYRLGNGQILDSMLSDGLHDAFSGEHSGWHTEDLVKQYLLSREEQDEWALRSHQRFSTAASEGRFKDEIVPVEVATRKGTLVYDTDESPRPDTTLDGLAKLKPVFRSDGTITAGNAPGMNSGASAMVVAERHWAVRHGLQPIARLVSYGIGAVAPDMFGIGPVPAVLQALQRAEWKISDLQRVEINEAFAAIAIAVMKELNIDPEIVNVEGGAIAHGHAIGATGAVLTTRLLHAMQRDKVNRGLVTMCIGGGQGIALILERE